MAKANDKPKPAVLHAIHTRTSGSYSFGDYRVTAGAITPVPEDARDMVCPDSSPVAFFASSEEAQDALDKLKPQTV
jgi:hypothetical protein